MLSLSIKANIEISGFFALKSQRIWQSHLIVQINKASVLTLKTNLMNTFSKSNKKYIYLKIRY